MKGSVLLKSVFRALLNMYGGAFSVKIIDGFIARLIKINQGGLKISPGSPGRQFTVSVQVVLMLSNRNLQKTDLVIFSEEILIGKFHFFWAVNKNIYLEQL